MKALAVLAATVAIATAAHAGRDCEARPPQATTVARSLDLAARTAKALDASGARVVVLARAGQDLRRWGLGWSHLGLAYRDGGRWLVVHKLNTCGTAQADLYRQGLGEFFLDELFEARAGFVIPAPEAQARLLALLADDARAARLHTPAYSMLAYPWAERYQQSNQWALETMAAALGDSPATRERSQAWLRGHGYEPTVLEIDAFTRLGARASRANIAFDDHPNGQRFAGRIATVTVDSVFAWMRRSGLGGAVEVVR